MSYKGEKLLFAMLMQHLLLCRAGRPFADAFYGRVMCRGSTDDVPDSHRFAAGHRDHADADAALGKSSGGGSGRGTLASPGAKAAPAPAAAPPVTTLGPSVPAAGLDTESEEMPSLSHAVGLGTPQRNSPQGNIAAQVRSSVWMLGAKSCYILLLSTVQAITVGFQ